MNGQRDGRQVRVRLKPEVRESVLRALRKLYPRADRCPQQRRERDAFLASVGEPVPTKAGPAGG